MNAIKEFIQSEIILSITFCVLLSYYKLSALLYLLILGCLLGLIFYTIYVIASDNKRYRNWKEKTPFFILSIFIGFHLKRIVVNTPDISIYGLFALIVLSLIFCLLLLNLPSLLFKLKSGQ